jgi:hypothetical protein
LALGSSLPTPFYKIVCKCRDCHGPDWEIKLWTDADLALLEPPLFNLVAFQAAYDLGM